jgi:acetylornithine deacetylase/succinyl-diaminopimelate desuccinylase-like protein
VKVQTLSRTSSTTKFSTAAGGLVPPALFLTIVCLCSIPTFAEQPQSDGLGREEVVRALEWIDASENRAVETLISLASIESPSGQEQERAHWVAKRMRKIGLRDVRVDELFNVTGLIEGRSDHAIVFITMLDDLATVAELQRSAERPPHRDGDRVVGPATEIQSVNAAALLAAEALVRSGLETEHNIVFAAVTQEETGLGGMKGLYERWKDRDAVWIDVLGDGSEIVYGAGTIHWWKVTAVGPGGHTEQDNMPNANLAIARAVGEILALPHPGLHEDSHINIGMISSGRVFNHKPESGWFSLDLRSMQPEVVGEMENAIRTILERVEADTGIELHMDPVMTIDGGQIPGARDSELVRLAADVACHLGLEPVISHKGCCNMAVPVAQGKPAIGLHGERGGGRATPDEWAGIPAMMRTARFVALLAAGYTLSR